MARDRKRRKKANEKKPDSGFEFGNFGIPPEHHAKFKAAVLEAARAGVAEYPYIVLLRLSRAFAPAWPLSRCFCTPFPSVC